MDDVLERLTSACWEHTHRSIAATHAAALLHKYSKVASCNSGGTTLVCSTLHNGVALLHPTWRFLLYN